MLAPGYLQAAAPGRPWWHHSSRPPVRRLSIYQHYAIYLTRLTLQSESIIRTLVAARQHAARFFTPSGEFKMQHLLSFSTAFRTLRIAAVCTGLLFLSACSEEQKETASEAWEDT